MRISLYFNALWKCSLLSIWIIFISACSTTKITRSEQFYFPSQENDEWESESVDELGWNTQELSELLTWLPTQDTRAFIILKSGKIVVEEYWGNKLTGAGKMDQDSYWYWASAGKTLTAAMIGIAEQRGFLKTTDSSQKYLGAGWSSLSKDQELNIRLVDHLSMTTGLDDYVDSPLSTSPSSLIYYTEPGKRWAYHNGPYTVLEKVVEEASGESFQNYFQTEIGDKIAMKGFWQHAGGNTVFYSSPRSMARFGLLLLANGSWGNDQILPSKFLKKMTQPSQKLNPSYGYLTWLNGKKSYLLPQTQRVFQGELVPSGPSDMYMALGKNGQLLLVVPSMDLVIVRMGGMREETLASLSLVRDIWDRLMPILQ